MWCHCSAILGQLGTEHLFSLALTIALSVLGMVGPAGCHSTMEWRCPWLALPAFHLPPSICGRSHFAETSFPARSKLVTLRSFPHRPKAAFAVVILCLWARVSARDLLSIDQSSVSADGNLEPE